MLGTRTVASCDGIEIADVVCRHARGPGESIEHSGRHALVFVRRGCFVRHLEGAEVLLDATVAYGMNPGEEQRYDHPHDGGDDCTALFFDAELVASLWGGDPALPSGPLFVSPEIDLAHRSLLACAGETTQHEAVELALELGARALAQADPARVDAARPATARARRAIVDGAREALAGDPGTSLRELALTLAVSPHHLSRVFRAATGHTVSRHRLRLRVRAALERLADGERDLARLAAELGFCDQSHLCRAVTNETGSTPGALRRALT